MVTGIPDKEKLGRLIAGNTAKLLLLARQSKSLVLGLWDKEELVSSNNNLKTMDCKRELSEFMVIAFKRNDFYFTKFDCQIPGGGVEGGLCGRMVLIRRG